MRRWAKQARDGAAWSPFMLTNRRKPAQIRTRAIFLALTAQISRSEASRIENFAAANADRLCLHQYSTFLRWRGQSIARFGGRDMKSPMLLLLSLTLIAPASAQQLPASPPPSAAAKNGTLQYLPAAQRLPAGNYRAEVRRGDAAAGTDEVAWSSAPHASMPDALREACKMIETVYTPGMRCPPAPGHKREEDVGECHRWQARGQGCRAQQRKKNGCRSLPCEWLRSAWLCLLRTRQQ